MGMRHAFVAKHEALAIYDVLVQECGAPLEGLWDFVEYVHRQATLPGPLEWRFMGDLGFGGKVYLRRRSRGTPEVQVAYYKEDYTPARSEAVRRANDRLGAMFG